MKKNVTGLLPYLIAFGSILIGPGIVYYGFEMVSIPHVREHNEGSVIIIGLILTLAGLGLGGYKILKARRRPVAPETSEPQAG